MVTKFWDVVPLTLLRLESSTSLYYRTSIVPGITFATVPTFIVWFIDRLRFTDRLLYSQDGWIKRALRKYIALTAMITISIIKTLKSAHLCYWHQIEISHTFRAGIKNRSRADFGIDEESLNPGGKISMTILRKTGAGTNMDQRPKRISWNASQKR